MDMSQKQDKHELKKYSVTIYYLKELIRENELLSEYLKELFIERKLIKNHVEFIKKNEEL